MQQNTIYMYKILKSLDLELQSLEISQALMTLCECIWEMNYSWQMVHFFVKEMGYWFLELNLI